MGPAMNKVILFLCLISFNAWALDFAVGNANFPSGVSVKCDSDIVLPMLVPTGTTQTAHIKTLYDHTDESPLMQTCYFSTGNQNLGSVTLRIILDKRDNDVMSGYIAVNNLQKRYSEISQSYHKIYIYFVNQ
jgi:hypothetical protein